MSQNNMAAQIVLEDQDFAGETLYAFGQIPENKKRNDEIIKRAMERRAARLGTTPPNRS
jgi:hypothetical protein